MPTGNSLQQLQIVDEVLTQIARQYTPRGFIYDEICPSISVQKDSGQYPTYDATYFFGDDVDNAIADRAETPEIEFAWSTDSYLCQNYGFKVSITPKELAQAHEALHFEASKVKFLMTRMYQRRERRLAAVLKKTTNGGKLTSGAAAGTAWASSTAVESDFKTAKMAVYNLTGLVPNVCVIPYAKAYDLATNTTLRDIWKHFVNNDSYIRLGADGEGEDIFLPRWFHGCRLIVPKGTLFNAAADNVSPAHEGASLNLVDSWGSSARFLYVDPNAGWGIPSTVYAFKAPTLVTGAPAGSGPVVDRWHHYDPVKDYIRVSENVTEKVAAPDTGYELTGI